MQRARSLAPRERDAPETVGRRRAVQRPLSATYSDVDLSGAVALRTGRAVFASAATAATTHRFAGAWRAGGGFIAR